MELSSTIFLERDEVIWLAKQLSSNFKAIYIIDFI